MARERKTVDCWRFFVNYGTGYEEECIEFTRKEMKVSRDAYRKNCSYPLEIRRSRMLKSEIDPYRVAEILANQAAERDLTVKAVLAQIVKNSKVDRGAR